MKSEKEGEIADELLYLLTLYQTWTCKFQIKHASVKLTEPEKTKE